MMQRSALAQPDPLAAHMRTMQCDLLQTLVAFQPLLKLRAAGGAAHRFRLYHEVLHAIATHRVGDGPDRFEPRLKKRRHNHYDWLTRSRAEIKRKMAKRRTENQMPFVGRTDARKTTRQYRVDHNTSLAGDSNSFACFIEEIGRSNA